MTADPNDDCIQPKIVRCRVDSLSLFEITDYELELLEQGSPNTIYLNIAIFFISVACSFLVTLLTVSITSQIIFTVFVIFTVAGFSIGGVLLILWFRTRSKVSTLIQKIKARVPVAAVAGNTSDIHGDKQTESSAD